jgi:hypothetical protein
MAWRRIYAVRVSSRSSFRNLSGACAIIIEYPGELHPAVIPSGKGRVLAGEWELSIATAREYPHFHDARQLEKLENIGALYPDFSGLIRYEKQFSLDRIQPTCLEIENAYDGVEAWVNGQYAGMQICPPYRFDLRGLVREGTNSLRIEVANTLDREVRALVGDDPVIKMFMGISALGPSGIVGEVRLYTGEADGN